jgi:hypothetical protein
LDSRYGRGQQRSTTTVLVLNQFGEPLWLSALLVTGHTICNSGMRDVRERPAAELEAHGPGDARALCLSSHRAAAAESSSPVQPSA